MTEPATDDEIAKAWKVFGGAPQRFLKELGYTSGIKLTQRRIVDYDAAKANGFREE